MKHRLFTAIASIALLAACSDEMHKLSNVSLTPAEDARQACRASHPAVKGNFVALARCLNGVDDQYAKPNNSDVDLVNRKQIARTALAQNVDAGQITIADYNNQMQAVEDQMAAEQHRRDMERNHNSWGISHGLDPASHDVNPVPVIPPG